jgi:hypothetical protein
MRVWRRERKKGKEIVRLTDALQHFKSCYFKFFMFIRNIIGYLAHLEIDELVSIVFSFQKPTQISVASCKQCAPISDSSPERCDNILVSGL